jgi:hypothetical protein
MTQVLVQHLVRRKVWYFIDQSSPLWLSNGLRYYQRNFGFRRVRFRPVRRLRFLQNVQHRHARLP